MQEMTSLLRKGAGEETAIVSPSLVYTPSGSYAGAQYLP